jgi:RNA recognition motif-containing protein
MDKIMKIYVGNLSPDTTEFQLRKAFERYGKVDLISMNGQPHKDSIYSFCFVNMPFVNQASQAIKKLNGKKLSGYILNIKESSFNI